MRRIFFTVTSFLMMIFLFFSVSCSSFISDVNDENQKKLYKDLEPKLLNFDSYSRILIMEIENIPDGTDFQASVNSKTVSSKIQNNLVSFDFSKELTNLLGGTELFVEILASGYGSCKKTFVYMPKIIFDYKTPREQTVFTKTTDKVVKPEITTNYNKDAVKITWKYNNDSAEFANWDEFLNALKNEENDGKDFYASAKAEAGSEISYILFKFLCVAEKEVKFVDINPCIITVTTVDESEKEKKEQYPGYECHLWNDEERLVHAGGIIKYQWQRGLYNDASGEVQWNDIENATENVYKIMTDDDFIGLLRLKIVQTIQNEEKEPVYSEELSVLGYLTDAKIEYDGIVLEGEDADFDKFNLVGEIGVNPPELISELNKEHLAVSPCYGLDIEKLLYSNTVDTFVMDTDFKFSLAMTKTYITVQAVLDDSEIPSLSTDKNNISLDKVVFDGNYPKVEFSLDDGATWKNVDETEFSLSEGSKILVRQKASGIKGENGYLKESDSKTIVVLKENIGTKSSSSGSVVISSEKPAVSIVKAKDGSKYTLTAKLNKSAEYYFENNNKELPVYYAWGWDFGTKDSTQDSDKSSVEIDVSEWNKGCYTVFLKVYLKTDNEFMQKFLTAQTNIIIE